MKWIAAAAIAVNMMLSTPLVAQDAPVVVELFTSQGCASCPPADRLLRDLARRDDVIALALHVDYWDYIGWKDPFARPDHAERQRGYARIAGRNMIYTPQMIVNGHDDVVGARAKEISELIEKYQAQSPVARLQAARGDGRLSIRAQALHRLPAPLSVQVVRYTPQHRTEITRGENAGQVLDYANVVDDWQVIGQWDGTSPLETSTPVQGPRPAVVLLQYPGPGAIAAAAVAR